MPGMLITDAAQLSTDTLAQTGHVTPTWTNTHARTHKYTRTLGGSKTFVNVAKYHLKEICSLAAA